MQDATPAGPSTITGNGTTAGGAGELDAGATVWSGGGGSTDKASVGDRLAVGEAGAGCGSAEGAGCASKGGWQVATPSSRRAALNSARVREKIPEPPTPPSVARLGQTLEGAPRSIGRGWSTN